MLLNQNDVHLWRYQLNENDYSKEMIDPFLSYEEKEKYKRFIHQKDAIKYICNHRFRRLVLSKYLQIEPSEIEFGYYQFGKPFIKKYDLFFNHSYRNNYGLLAISKKYEIGVDIEFMKDLQDAHTFSSFSFSAHEKAVIFKNEVINKEALFAFWTFKEAFIKATGTGLNVDISKINLADFLQQETNVMPSKKNKLWSIKKLEAPNGYKAAIAFQGELMNLREFNFD